MKRELTLTNKRFAEELVAHLNEKEPIAKLEEKDSKFIVAYETTAADGQCVDEKLAQVAQYLFRVVDDRFNYVLRQIDQIWTQYDKHTVGHLPQLSPSGLAKLIKAAGQEDDFEVRPRMVWASQGGIEFGAQELKDALTKINESAEASTDKDISRLMDVIRAQKK